MRRPEKVVTGDYPGQLPWFDGDIDRLPGLDLQSQFILGDILPWALILKLKALGQRNMRYRWGLVQRQNDC